MMATLENINYLRKCRVCGLEAGSLEDLYKFHKSRKQPHGYDNLCKSCQNTSFREGGRYANLKKNNNAKRPYETLICFKEKQILLKKNPRTNVCSICNRKYPDDLKQQTSMHHVEYHPTTPLQDTIEICASCHAKIHHLGMKKGNIPWNKGLRKTEKFSTGGNTVSLEEMTTQLFSTRIEILKKTNEGETKESVEEKKVE